MPKSKRVQTQAQRDALQKSRDARKRGVKSQKGTDQHPDPPKKVKFGELTHDVPVIAQEAKKVKEKEVFVK